MNSEHELDAIIERLKIATGAQSGNEVAELMGLSSSGLANYKKRGTIPYEKIVAFAGSRNVSIDWVLAGKGAIKRSQGAGLDANPLQGELLRIFDALDDSGRRRLIVEAEQIKELRDLRQRVTELETQIANSGGAQQNFHSTVNQAVGRDLHVNNNRFGR